MRNNIRSRSAGIRAFKLRTSECVLVALYLVYFLALLLIYSYGIAPTYAYMGFAASFSKTNFIVSILCLFLSAPFLRPNEWPSGFFLGLTAATILVPSLVLYTGAGLPHRFALLTVTSVWVISLTARALRLKAIKLPTASRSNLLLLFALVSLGAIGLIVAYGGARHFNLKLSAVYDLRREAAASLPGIFGYLNSITSKIIIPFALVFSAQKRNWFAVTLLGILSVLMFALTAHKSPLFYPLVVGFVYLIAGKRYVHQIILAGLIAMLAICALDLWAKQAGFGGGAGWFASLFARRALLVPSLLNWFYLDYFQEAPKYLWAGSKFSLGLVESPHALKSVNLIGLEYFGREEMSANTGWIGSGYANAGIPGLLLYSITIGALFALFDAYVRRLGSRTIIALFVVLVFTLLTSSDLSTMLITHGLLLSIIVLGIIRPDPKQRLVKP